jgi:hypothetical protein
MDEIKVGVVGDALKQRVIVALPDVHLVPAHMRHFQVSPEAAHPAGENPQTQVCPHLFALLEKYLHAQADTQKGLASSDLFLDGLGQLLRQEIVHGVAESAHSRQHDAAGIL